MYTLLGHNMYIMYHYPLYAYNVSIYLFALIFHILHAQAVKHALTYHMHQLHTIYAITLAMLIGHNRYTFAYSTPRITHNAHENMGGWNAQQPAASPACALDPCAWVVRPLAAPSTNHDRHCPCKAQPAVSFQGQVASCIGL